MSQKNAPDVSAWAVGGITAQVVGGIVAGLAWPGMDAATGLPEGSGFWAVVGLLAIGLGWLATMVAVVAKGVTMGLQISHQTERTSA